MRPQGAGRLRPAVLLLLALALTGCSVSLIAPYDEPTDLMLTSLAGKVDRFFIAMDVERPPYAAAAPAYESVRSDLRVLRLRNQVRPKNDLTVHQIDRIGGAWDELEALHRKADQVSPTAALIARDVLSQALRASIKLELEKRRLR